jgi:beta-galactosidase beta subunit
MFFPDDAHAPLVSADRIRKVVLKIELACGAQEPACMAV